MSVKRKQYGTKFKAKVAQAAIVGDKTLSEIASEYGVHPQQVGDWKAQAIIGLPSLFERKNKKKDADFSKDVKELRAKIGQQTMELDFLARGLGLTTGP